MAYVLIIEIGTESLDEAEEVRLEASDDGRITKTTLARISEPRQVSRAWIGTTVENDR